MKTKKLLIFLLILGTTFSMCGQNKRTLILGTILSKTVSVENIHVLNLTTKRGLVTNLDGEFEINVKESDTLFFSGIQFQEEKMIITKEILDRSELLVYLQESSYSLDEVVLQKEVSDDSKRKKQDFLSSYALDFSAKNFPDSRTLIDEDSRMTTSNDSQIGGGRGSGLFYIASLLLQPIIKPIGKAIKRKSKEKAKTAAFNQSVKEAVDNEIRDYLGDSFFTNDLTIPKDHINLFIEFCASKNIGAYFLKKQDLKLIDVFIKEIDNYKRINNL